MGEGLTGAAAARVEGLWAAARASGQRRAIVLYGSVDETRRRAAAALALGGVEALWIGDAPDGVERLAPGRARAALGREVAAAVVDLHSGVDGEAVGAVSGAVGAGGFLVLRAPVGFGAGSRFEGLFAAAWAGCLGVDAAGRVVGGDGIAGDGTDGIHAMHGTDGTHGIDDTNGTDGTVGMAGAGAVRCRTADQARAVEAVLRCATGRRRRPVVLTADRGRGKSAALGIAVGRLLRDPRPDGARAVVVVAPRRSAVEPVFAFAARAAGVAAAGAGATLTAAGGSLRFVGPAELCEGAEGAAVADAALVLVDEAAGLPVPLLTRLLRAHPRVVFATTVHGYEGTGRGFALRFSGVLDREAPGWRAVRLDAPVRWRAGDPVEAAVGRALLLDAQPADDAAVAGASGGSVRVARWAMKGAGATLGSIWGLLVAAHYRTSPADLQRLLDDAALAVWVAWEGEAGEAVAGVALVAREGGFEPALAAEVHAGRRRPPGHVLPEALAAQLDVAAAPGLRAARVVRIAVHPAAQGRGVGRALLAAVERESGVDYVGTTFGCTQALWQFWRGAGYVGVRVGVRRGRSSGLRSALMLKAVSAAGAAAVAAARARFVEWFAVALGEPLATLESGLAVALLAGAEGGALDGAARRELALFAAGGREYEAVVDRLWRAAPGWVAAGVDDAGWLVERVLQRRGWGPAGRAAGQARLRAVVGAALGGGASVGDRSAADFGGRIG